MNNDKLEIIIAEKKEKIQELEMFLDKYKDIIEMIRNDKELSYILQDVLIAKKYNINIDVAFQVRSNKVKNKKYSFTDSLEKMLLLQNENT